MTARDNTNIRPGSGNSNIKDTFIDTSRPEIEIEYEGPVQGPSFSTSSTQGPSFSASSAGVVETAPQAQDKSSPFVSSSLPSTFTYLPFTKEDTKKEEDTKKGATSQQVPQAANISNGIRPEVTEGKQVQARIARGTSSRETSTESSNTNELSSANPRSNQRERRRQASQQSVSNTQNRKQSSISQTISNVRRKASRPGKTGVNTGRANDPIHNLFLRDNQRRTNAESARYAQTEGRLDSLNTLRPLYDQRTADKEAARAAEEELLRRASRDRMLSDRELFSELVPDYLSLRQEMPEGYSALENARQRNTDSAIRELADEAYYQQTEGRLNELSRLADRYAKHAQEVEDENTRRMLEERSSLIESISDYLDTRENIPEGYDPIEEGRKRNAQKEINLEFDKLFAFIKTSGFVPPFVNQNGKDVYYDPSSESIIASLPEGSDIPESYSSDHAMTEQEDMELNSIENDPVFNEAMKDAEEVKRSYSDVYKKTNESVERNKSEIFRPIKLENQTVDDKTGEILYNDVENRLLNDLAYVLRINRDSEGDSSLFEVIRTAISLGSDKNGKIWGRYGEKEGLTDDELAKAVYIITSSIEQYGHPWGVTQANYDLEIGGSVRFPCGIIPVELAQMLENKGMFHGMSATDIRDTIKDQWNKDTYDKLTYYAQAMDRGIQLGAIENMMRAYCEVEGIDSYSEFGVAPIGGLSYSDELAENSYAAEYIGAGEHARKFQTEKNLRAWNRLNQDKAARTARYKAVDEKGRELKKKDIERRLANGEKLDDIKGTDAAFMGRGDELFRAGISLLRGIRVFGDPRQLVSSFIEHGINNLEVKVANALVLQGNKDYKLSADTYKRFTEDKQAMEYIANLKTMQEAGGWDLVQAFLAENIPPTSTNVRKFMADIAPKHNFDRLSEWTNSINETLSLWMQGDSRLYAKNDAARWLESYMVNMSAIDGYNANQIAQQINDNPGAFVTSAFNNDFGKDAWVTSHNLYAGRISPLTDAIRSTLSRNGLTDTGVAIILDSPFVNYGVKAFELWFPFSNTFSWLAANQLVKNGTDVREIKASLQDGEDLTFRQKMKEKFSVDNPDIMNNVIGGSLPNGLARAIQFDMIKLGQNGLSMMFVAGLISFFGGIKLEDGDDDDPKKYLPWEQKIQFPWNDSPVPVKMQWYMDDIFQWSFYGGIALAYSTQTGDANGATRMFWNGCYDVFGSNQVVKMVGGLLDLYPSAMELFCDAEKHSGIDDGLTKNNMQPDLSAALLVNLASRLSKSTPMAMDFIYPWMSDGITRNAYKYADGTSRENKYESIWNKYALNNPFVGLVGNIASGVFTGNFNRFGERASDYKYFGDEGIESELAEKKYTLASYKGDTNLSDEEAEEAWALHMIEVISSYDDPAQAIKDGVMVHADDVYALKKYVNGKISEGFKHVNNAAAAYGNYETTWNDYSRQKANWYSDEQYYKYKGVMDALAFSNLIYDPKVYIEVTGTTARDESGERYNYGDIRGVSNLLPFFTPQDATYNNTFMGDRFFNTKIGPSLETNRADVNTDGMTDEQVNNMPTSGARNLVANPESQFVKNFKAEYEDLKAEWDKLAGEADGAYTKAKESRGSSGGGGRSYGYGGGGGSGSKSYSPNIYSYSKNISASKPSTMYSKTPYTTSNRYLSPTVYTTGSRNAYSRREG